MNDFVKIASDPNLPSLLVIYKSRPNNFLKFKSQSVSSVVHIDTGEGRGRHSKSHSERDEVDLEH